MGIQITITKCGLSGDIDADGSSAWSSVTLTNLKLDKRARNSSEKSSRIEADEQTAWLRAWGADIPMLSASRKGGAS